MTVLFPKSLTRRRFLAVSAAAGTALGAGPSMAGVATATWRGRALGAQASMQIVGLGETDARQVFRKVELELARLERIFSLYDPASELSRLNAGGVLMSPAPEMLELLSLCGALNAATDGAFDPTMQPLWQAHAWAAGQDRAATDDELFRASGLCGWQGVTIATNEVRLARPGMALSLNGVAQGYITDRIATLLKGEGLGDLLIDMGEISGVGKRADGSGWEAGIALPDGTILERITLTDRALATSSPTGTVLNRHAQIGHILDPRGRLIENAPRLVSVSADRAAVADGLSTAGCLLSGEKLDTAIIAFPNAKLETVI